jgi:uncharacterized protein
MGEIIEIREVGKDGSFRIGFTVTGEERNVSLDPEKRELFQVQDIRMSRPMACPFLREDGKRKFVCSVHASRPGLCRQYSCYRILVLDSKGNRIGKVTDASRHFTTADAELRRIWDREVAGAAFMDEDGWEEHVEQVLTGAGYRVVR